MYDVLMKRFLFVLTLVLLLGNFNYADAASAGKSDVKAIKNILKSQIQAANKYSYPDFIKYFDFGYINSDGFGLDIYSKLVEDTWAAYSNIQYAQKVKNITVNGKDAIAEVIETANAQIESQYNLRGNLKSIANNVYFLKKTTNGWRIVSDIILTEDTYLAFGEMADHAPVLNIPYQIGANSNYTASLEYTPPKNTIAIASINQEKVSYPQETSKENYRKLPDDGILERFFTSNADGVNEYIVASIGLTRPEFENKDLQINVTGVAYVIKRINVIPENKFINKEGIVPVKERLLKLQENDRAVEQAEKEKFEADKHEIKSKKEEGAAPAQETTAKPADEKIKNEKVQSGTNVEEVTKPAAPGEKVKQKKTKVDTEKAKVKKEKNAEAKSKAEPGQKVKNKNKKQKKDKSLKGTYSPSTIDIPTSATVCPVKEPGSTSSL